MAGMRLLATLHKSLQLGAVIGLKSPAASARLLVTAAPRPLQECAKDNRSAAEQVVEKTKEVANKVFETAQDISEKVKQKTQDAKEVANNVSETTEDTGDKAKQRTQHAWESTKKGTEGARNIVAAKVKEAKTVKDNIVEKVKDKKLSETVTGTITENATEKTTEEIMWKTTDVVAEAVVGKVPKTIIKEGYKIVRDSVNKK